MGRNPRGAVKISTTAATTAALLAGRDAIAAAGGPAIPPGHLDLVSPVTAPCRVVAQAVNFRSHAIDSGIDPDRVPAAFFRKTSGSISGPYADITKPAHVRFLDYEVEIGLVLGAEVPVGTTITTANIAGYVAGLVITNDVSARDLQLPKTQFFESKSYPTFTPVGPRLVLLDTAELARFTDLRLQTWVNGELRQDQTAADMITGPVMALNILTGFQALSPGDLLLTGTPGGTALKAPPKPAQILVGLLPTHLKWKAFFGRQAGNPNYLHHGDVVELRIATPDGVIDLGRRPRRHHRGDAARQTWDRVGAAGEVPGALPAAARGSPGRRGRPDPASRRGGRAVREDQPADARHAAGRRAAQDHGRVQPGRRGRSQRLSPRQHVRPARAGADPAGQPRGPPSGDPAPRLRGHLDRGHRPGHRSLHQDGAEHQITADALLGADGTSSLVRQAIGSGLRDLRFAERWLVIDVRSRQALCDWGGVYQICDPARAATFMHVTGDRYRWEFRLADGETADDLTAPGQLARLLKLWTTDIADLEIIRQATYTFRARVADRWRQGRVFLLGDAAHQTPPFIGQGLGAGLRDAANLTWKLAAVLHGQVGEEILDSYEQERRPHATRTIRAEVTVGWALTGGQDRAAIIRRIALAGLCRLPGFSTALVDSASPG